MADTDTAASACAACMQVPEFGGRCEKCGATWKPDRLGTLQRVPPKRPRRAEWQVVLAMILGGCAPFALVVVWPAWWTGVVVGLLFWPCAFIGGAFAIRGEI